ncbi:uncharacterized protein EDB91DRAFT_1256601 [Suillus paluster]|uniref:uncharacterized protein n=1 Tax=Suillus paluster TaxID=48578 RepID=UPI001B874FEE|nr:uncharacterized protein EDB91DRAFT_1256601 [Suillus paluster]KAG1721245.1 hypothetical protein EDB91DRAFT_1256601 [Suillus paluster]
MPDNKDWNLQDQILWEGLCRNGHIGDYTAGWRLVVSQVVLVRTTVKGVLKDAGGIISTITKVHKGQENQSKQPMDVNIDGSEEPFQSDATTDITHMFYVARSLEQWFICSDHAGDPPAELTFAPMHFMDSSPPPPPPPPPPASAPSHVPARYGTANEAIVDEKLLRVYKGLAAYVRQMNSLKGYVSTLKNTFSAPK